MTSSVESICIDLGIEIIPTKQRTAANQTKAGQTLGKILRKYGAGHLILTLRAIIESNGNDRALIGPVIWAVSDTIAAHPDWTERGLAWIEAFDDIDVLDLAAGAKANRKAVAPRAAIATMLHALLSPLFDSPKPKRRTFKHSRTTPRYVHLRPAGEAPR